jgi:hypothetical protein
MGFYGFAPEANERYAKMANRFAAKYKDQLRTSVMVPPLPAAFYLPEKYKNYSSNEKAALEFLYGRLSGDVNKVNVFDIIAAHKDEYIYFRTDHHWTGLGAYYAYSDYMRTLGLQPKSLGEYVSYEHKPFLGSFYRMLGGNPKLKANPDICTVYKPLFDYKMMVYYNGPGTTPINEQNLGKSPDKFKSEEKYLAYAGGDPPYETIVTENKTGRRLLVFKESFANAMLPFFAEHFEEIHVIDYRYFKGDVNKIIKDAKITEALFLNYIGAVGYGPNVTQLEKLLGFAK